MLVHLHLSSGRKREIKRHLIQSIISSTYAWLSILFFSRSIKWYCLPLMGKSRFYLETPTHLIDHLSSSSYTTTNCYNYYSQRRKITILHTNLMPTFTPHSPQLVSPQFCFLLRCLEFLWLCGTSIRAETLSSIVWPRKKWRKTNKLLCSTLLCAHNLVGARLCVLCVSFVYSPIPILWNI